MGLALVRHFLGAGHSVATCSRRGSPALSEVGKSASWAERFMFEEVDLAEQDAVRKFTQGIAKRFGRIDVLVNNAAIVYDGMLATQPMNQMAQMIDVNLKGPLFLSRECLRVMVPRSSGRIINVASIVGIRGAAGLVVYSSTKAALLGLTRSLAREVGPRGITVNAVAPGYLETEMSHGLNQEQRQQIVQRTPLARLGRVEDLVPLVAFLASEQAAFITGEIIAVDGGLSC